MSQGGLSHTTSNKKKEIWKRWCVWGSTKLARGCFLLLGSSFIIYATLRSAPGDMVDLILGLNGTPEMKADLRSEFGLDLNVIEGYLSWFWKAMNGDLGISITFMPGEPVLSIAGPAFLVTLGIAVVSLISSILIALSIWPDSIIIFSEK